MIPDLVFSGFGDIADVVDFDSCDGVVGVDYCTGRDSRDSEAEDADGRRLANRDTVVQVPW